MKYAGLDYGEKTLGISVSDSLEISANPVKTIRRNANDGLKGTIAELKEIKNSLGIETFVLGYPKNLNNTASDRTLQTDKFHKLLLKEFDIPVILWDERLSTVHVERIMIDADMSRKKRKEKIDAAAATTILQNFLDYKYNMKKASEKKNAKNTITLRWRQTKMSEEFDEMLEGEENEEFDVIVLTDDETGEDVELVIVDSVECDDCSYLLVIASEDFEEEEPSASIIKEIKDENGEFVYEVVEDEEEFEKASELFKDNEDFEIQ